MRLALGTGTVSIRTAVARFDQSAVDRSLTADVVSCRLGVGEAGRNTAATAATFDNEFVKFVIAAAIEREPSPIHCKLLLLLLRLVVWRWRDATKRLSTSHQTASPMRATTSLARTVARHKIAFPTASTTAVYTSHGTQPILSLVYRSFEAHG